MRFEGTASSLQNHTVPDWYNGAKFGIFVHWGIYSIPAFAPVPSGNAGDMFADQGPQEAFKHQPYAEWYLNSLRIPDSPVGRYHKETYGEGTSYWDFARRFNEAARDWRASEWASLFAEAGARYVVLVTKHHDGFLLWNPRARHPFMPTFHAERNVVAELTEAVRAAGMRMGYYYSGLLDWTFTRRPIRDFVDLMTRTPTSRDYVAYQERHWRELMTTYRPSILWSDIGYPPGSNVAQLMADYYNMVPDGVVNDRWVQLPGPARFVLQLPIMRRRINRQAAQAFEEGATNPMKPVHADFTTPEYRTLSEVTEEKWEATRGIGQSFAYNQLEPEDAYLTLPELTRLFTDIISKNGNLLLNVGPKANGSIPEIQARLLRGFGAWMRRFADGIYDTKPFTTAGYDGEDGTQVRFTRNDTELFVFVSPGGADQHRLSLPTEADAGSLEAMDGSGTVATDSEGRLELRDFRDHGAGTVAFRARLRE
jgi:alpha-L-fucosidase